MNVLLVEDNYFKSDQILTYLNSFGKFNTKLRMSYHAALKTILSDTFYDLILLDISLPGFNDNDISESYLPSGGKHLFSQLYLNDIVSKVIVITLYRKFEDGSEIEQLNDLFKLEYAENYLGYVLYNNNDTKWQIDLTNIFKENNFI